MRISDAWRRVDQPLLDTARGVTLETPGASGRPVRLLLANLSDPSLADPAVVVGSLLVEIADAITESPAMELATFRALGRLQDGALGRVDFTDAGGQLKHALVVAFPHPGVAGGSVFLTVGAHDDLRFDAELAAEIDQMLGSIHFIARDSAVAVQSVLIPEIPVSVEVGQDWDGPRMVGRDAVFRTIAPNGSLVTLRLRSYEEAEPVGSTTPLNRYLNELGSDPAYRGIVVDARVERAISFGGRGDASSAELQYERAQTPYRSMIMAVAYPDLRSVVADVQLEAEVHADVALAEAVMTLLGSIRRV